MSRTRTVEQRVAELEEMAKRILHGEGADSPEALERVWAIQMLTFAAVGLLGVAVLILALKARAS